jgi:hypothetical membrane protein
VEANVLIFALLSLLGSLVYIAVVAALHVLPTGYNPARNAVSDYGVGQYAPLFRVSLWAGSIAVAAPPVQEFWDAAVKGQQDRPRASDQPWGRS